MNFMVILIVSSHIFADYAFQNEWMVNKKKNGKWWAILLHVFIFFLLTLLIIHPWLSIKNVLIVSIISILHGIADVFKNRLQKKRFEFQFELEIIDQLVHLFCIWLVIFIFNGYLNEIILKYSILSIVGLRFYLTILIYLSALVVLLKAANIWIRELILKVKKSRAQKIDKTGRLIGNLERILIFIMILVNQWAAIGFIITSKSIARFEEMKEKKRFAEYYIIGTLASTLIAIMVGKVVQYLTGIL